MNEEKEKRFVSIREASLLTGIESQTLRKLGDQKKIKCYKTPSGQRKFDRSCLEAFCDSLSNDPQVQENKRKNFIYTRVSSKKQMDDLSRQLEYIKSRDPRYATYVSLSDVASGINFKREGLSSILDSCLQGTIGEVIVAHRDRLSRFGFDLIKLIITKSGGKLIVLDDDKHKTSEQELAEDLLSIVHIYSCRQLGKRKYKSSESAKNKTETNNESA